MNRSLLILLMVLFTLGSCKYQKIYEREVHYSTAFIPVHINWEESGFDIDSTGATTRQGGGTVHRATVRLFPADGSEPIERYLESNVFRGYIEVPIGKYSVVVMNESIYDSYWQGSESSGFQSIEFNEANSYENFSAAVKTHSENPSGYFFSHYVSDNYLFMQPPLRLASWALDSLHISQEMADHSQLTRASELTPYDSTMYYALTRDEAGDSNGIDMRRLTRDVNVGIRVKNLTSASTIKGGITGFVNRVSMRRAEGYREPQSKTMVQYFTFNGRKNWVDADGNPKEEGWQPAVGENIYEDYTGETSASFLSFGRDLALGDQEHYDLDLDMIYLSGELVEETVVFTIDHDRDPSTPEVETTIPIDVTEQVLSGSGSSGSVDLYTLDIDIFISTMIIEYTEGDISVSDWGDDVVIPLG